MTSLELMVSPRNCLGGGTDERQVQGSGSNSRLGLILGVVIWLVEVLAQMTSFKVRGLLLRLQGAVPMAG
jgi:hypothetical protein